MYLRAQPEGEQSGHCINNPQVRCSFIKVCSAGSLFTRFAAAINLGTAGSLVQTWPHNTVVNNPRHIEFKL